MGGSLDRCDVIHVIWYSLVVYSVISANEVDYMYEACVSFLASSSIIFPVIVGVGNVGEESTSSTRLLERAPRRGKVFSLELWVSQRRGKQSNTPSKCRKLSRISQYQNPPALSINLKYVLDRWGRFPDKKISDTFSIFSMIILVKFS